MTPEEIIRNALDGKFIKVHPDGRIEEMFVDKDFIPDHCPPTFPQPKSKDTASILDEWYVSEEFQLIAEYRTDKSIEAIASDLKRSVNAVKRKVELLVKEGTLTRRPKGIRKPAWTHWPKHFCARVDTLLAMGATYNDIMKRLGLSKEAVRRYVADCKKQAAEKLAA